MEHQSYPLAKVYGLLEPGPVILLTTTRNRHANIMTLSWLTMLDFDPPLVGCVVGNRNHSFTLLQEKGEAVINIPTVELADQVVGCGNTTGMDVDKFARFGLTPLPASLVAAPRIAECYAHLECRVVDTSMVPWYGLFVLEVVKAWVDATVDNPQTLHHRGYGRFMVAGEELKLKSKMR